LTWPALPGAGGAALLALLFQFEQSQWWPPESLREHQFGQLEVLLRHAAKTVPFYQARFAAAGFDHMAGVTPETWARLPILTRTEVRESLAALTSRGLPKSHGKTAEITTSGSTGTPIKTLSTALTGVFWTALTIRDHLWRRRDLSKTFAYLRRDSGGGATYPEGIRSDRWRGASGSVFATGPGALLSITTPVEQQAEWLQRMDPDYLSTHPSNLAELLVTCERQGVELSRLREVQTVSEVLDPATRELCRRLWGVPIADVYSAQEVGYIALQCLEHEHYHAQAESALVEIVDDEGRPCGPGATGRIIVTPLHNFATPLIRYEIGDYAEVGEACGCGRGLPVLAQVMGRARNMLTLPSGQRFWPFLGGRTLYDIAPLNQYQLVQKSTELIEVRLVVGRALTDGEEERLREAILSRLGHPFELRFAYHDRIPRSAGGKYEDFRSEIA